MRVIWWVVTLAQVTLALRFAHTLLLSINGERIGRGHRPPPRETVSVIVPVLNEATRLSECLEALSRQGDFVREILVVDGGSTDGTRELVFAFSSREPRVRLVDAGALPVDWNGKAWGLEVGLRTLGSSSDWVATIDADVRTEPDAVRRVAGFASERGIDVLSVACEQVADTLGLSLIHPSLLASLVYRFGAPGQVATSVEQVASNGQFALYRHSALRRAGGFAMARDSICEDVTLARHLHTIGEDVGFYEGPGLAQTLMYSSGAECLRNWPRSLSLRDRIRPYAGIGGLANMVLLQASPALARLSRVYGVNQSRQMSLVDRLLTGLRLGVLIGTRRAYVDARWTYWLSPLFDPFATTVYVLNLLRRRHTWRGRQLVGFDGRLGEG